jgi:hypothetical protein
MPGANSNIAKTQEGEIEMKKALALLLVMGCALLLRRNSIRDRLRPTNYANALLAMPNFNNSFN